MEHEFWEEIWQAGDIPFHNAEVAPALARFWSGLDIADGATVLVPLCGKSLDMIWLRDQGYKMVGAELSELAVNAG